MKTNEEFLREVYGKRDRVVKKRKKQMAFAATAVCAVLCIGAAATAGLLDENGVNKFSLITEIEQDGFLNKNGNESYSGEIEAEDVFSADGNQTEVQEAVTEATYCFGYLTKDNAEIAEGVTEIAIEGVIDKQLANENAEGVLSSTEAVEEATVQGNLVIETTAVPQDIIDAESETTTAAPPKAPKPSNEKIVETAYNLIPEGERVYIIKESAEVTVEKYNDGRHEYVVYFSTTQDKYMGVRLDSELNPVPFKEMS